MIFTNQQINTNGRLGNQMFQIAACIGIASMTGNLYRLPKWNYAYNFMQPYIPIPVLESEITHLYKEPAFHYTEFNIRDTKKIREGNNYLVNLIGYFQSEMYFKQFEHAIKMIFAFNDDLQSKTKNFIEQIKFFNVDMNLVSVHFRFGDYVDNPFYVNLHKTTYYEMAFLTRPNYQDDFYIVFSDEPAQADAEMQRFKKQLPKLKYVIIQFTSEIEDLCMMTLLEHHIIANSSFSWWGAWLSNDKQIIAPAKWFGETGKLDTKDLYCDRMIKI